MALMPFAGQFTKASGSQQIPAGGLTVTFTLVQVALSGGAMTTLVNAGSATEVTTNTPGTYFYVYSGSLDFTNYFYVGAFKTTDATVQATQVPAAYFDFPLSIAKDGSGRVDVGKVAGTAQTARDLGANLDAAVSSRSTFAGGAVASVTADVGITQAGADKVWGSAARTLTGFGTLVADVAAAVWAAASRTLTAFGFTVTAGTVSDKTGYSLAAGERDAIAAALLDLANGVETGLTPRQFARLAAAVLLGKSSGGGAVYRDTGDTKDRVSAVMDGSGNRTNVVRDAT